MMSNDLASCSCWTAKSISVNGKKYCQGHIYITDNRPVEPLDKCIHCNKWIGNRKALKRYADSVLHQDG